MPPSRNAGIGKTVGRSALRSGELGAGRGMCAMAIPLEALTTSTGRRVPVWNETAPISLSHLERYSLAGNWRSKKTGRGKNWWVACNRPKLTQGEFRPGGGGAGLAGRNSLTALVARPIAWPCADHQSPIGAFAESFDGLVIGLEAHAEAEGLEDGEQGQGAEVFYRLIGEQFCGVACWQARNVVQRCEHDAEFADAIA
jgi:hypothetical protein